MSEISKNQWKVNYLYRLQQICNKQLEPFYDNKLEPENKEREVKSNKETIFYSYRGKKYPITWVSSW